MAATSLPVTALLAIAAMASSLGVTVAGCGGTGKGETAALLNAVDRYRDADGPSKLVRGQAVAAVACSAAAVCDAKRVCLAAIEPTTRALELKDDVAARVADIERRHLDVASPEAQGLAGKLDEATKLLETGRQKMSECERRLAELRVRFGS